MSMTESNRFQVDKVKCQMSFFSDKITFVFWDKIKTIHQLYYGFNWPKSLNLSLHGWKDFGLEILTFSNIEVLRQYLFFLSLHKVKLQCLRCLPWANKTDGRVSNLEINENILTILIWVLSSYKKYIFYSWKYSVRNTVCNCGKCCLVISLPLNATITKNEPWSCIGKTIFLIAWYQSENTTILVLFFAPV